jgi:DNA-directed RNA polymerase specialized sigma subunit
MEKLSCKDCSHYKYCKKPCIAVLQYINQDENEEAWVRIRFTDKIEAKGNIKGKEAVSTTEVILQNYFIDRMKPKDIAERYYKSQQYVYRIIKKYSKIIAENIKKAAQNG